MRTDPEAGRGILFADVREQEEHEQRSSFGGEIGAPGHEIRIFQREAHINVPTRVTGIVGRRKSDRERAEARAWKPSPGADELIERLVKDRSVSCKPERLLSVVPQPDDRPAPCRGIIWIATGVAPEDRPGLLRDVAGKRAIDPDKPIVNELLYLRVAERAGHLVIAGHDVLL